MSDNKKDNGAVEPAVQENDKEVDKAETQAEDLLVPSAKQLEAGIDAAKLESLRDDIVAALKSVYDPEIPVDIYELGLIYRVDFSDNNEVDVLMTLTAPGCPVAGEMPIWVQDAVESVSGVSKAHVELTFDPPWTPDRMSDEAKFALNWF